MLKWLWLVFIPFLREKLLSLRHPYGWEDPDYSKEESHLYDEQYQYHQIYIHAIEETSGLPIHRAISLTNQEKAGLTEIAGKAKLDGIRIGGDGTGAVRLTQHQAMGATPSWSPDGNKIAFSSKRDGDSQIHIMNSDGTNVVRYTDQPHGASGAMWLPNGKIAFMIELSLKKGVTVRNPKLDRGGAS